MSTTNLVLYYIPVKHTRLISEYDKCYKNLYHIIIHFKLTDLDVKKHDLENLITKFLK
jgi:hypothetical protein